MTTNALPLVYHPPLRAHLDRVRIYLDAMHNGPALSKMANATSAVGCALEALEAAAQEIERLTSRVADLETARQVAARTLVEFGEHLQRQVSHGPHT